MMNSLLEFTRLLNDHLSDLLYQESGNDKYIYLYLADGYWVAFEKSAYRLYHIYDSVMLLPMKLPFSPFPIVTASIKRDCLHAAIGGLVCRKRSRHERIYLAKRDTDVAAYQKWYSKVTHALRNLPQEALLSYEYMNN